MKILIGMTRADTIVSGSFKHIQQIGKAFRDDGHDVVYVLGGQGAAAKSLIEQEFQVICLTSLTRNLHPFKDLLSLLKLISILLRIRPDLCSWHTAKIGALGRIAGWLTGNKSVYIAHGVPFTDIPQNKGAKLYARLEKLLARLPGTILGVCEFDCNEYRRIGVPEHKLAKIYNGMRRQAHTKALHIRKEQPVRFITAARFEAQKDYQTLAAACEVLSQQGKAFSLDIYGDGPQETSVKALFSNLSDEQVRFCGVVPDFSLALMQADVFVLSTHWEGLPRSIIEAMSCSCPVIATRVGGCAELIDGNGFTVGHQQVQPFAQAMQSYIDDPGLVAVHGLRSVQLFEHKFELEVMLNHYRSTYYAMASHALADDDGDDQGMIYERKNG